MSDWLPIESAPKDKSTVLIFDNGLIVTAHWYDGRIYHNGETYGFYDDPVEFIPTHWQPLPAPPSGSEATAEDGK